MYVHEASRSLLLRCRNPLAIKQIIPKSRIVEWEGHNIAVRHGLEEVKVLQNMGIKAPSPILHYYDWPGRFTPYAHQRATSAFLTEHKKAFVLNEMGAGKTASALWAADYLISEGAVRRVLIVSPLSTLERVWSDEIFGTLMHRTCIVLHGSKQRRLDALATDVDFYIINHDGLPVIHDELLKHKDIDLIIFDEASVLRNAKTRRYKMMKKLIQPHHRLWLLTGTPCPNAPTDAWALAKLVNPTSVPEYFGSFQRMTMYQISQFGWKPKPEGFTLAYNALQPGIRFRKEDCIDLPPMTVEDRECPMSEEQQAAFNEMKSYMAATAATTTITAVNAADQINKLRQILCGVVKVPGESEYSPLDFKPRAQVLMETLEEAGAKAIVVVPFKGIVYELAKEVEKKYSCAVLNGDVSPKQRNEIVKAFKTSPNPHVLLCHPKVMSHGLNLTEADLIVLYAPIYSSDEYQQLIERINRPGQTRKMTVVRLGAHRLEWDIYRVIDGKNLSQSTILDMYKNVLLG